MSGRHRPGGDNFLAPDRDGVGADAVDLVELQVPQLDAASLPAPVSATIEHTTLTAEAVVAEEVSYTRAGRRILESVSVSAIPGRALAITGPSGSGKSSLLALLAGLQAPDSGTVRRAPEERVGLVLQGYGLVAVLTAAENVEAPLQAGVLGRLSSAQVRQRAAAVLDSVGLISVADHLIEELSGGQQQRVAVARALVVEPTVVLADELTAELDHDWKERVVRLVLDVADRGGVVVLATHDPGIAAMCADSIHLIDGRIASPTDTLA